MQTAEAPKARQRKPAARNLNDMQQLEAALLHMARKYLPPEEVEVVKRAIQMLPRKKAPVYAAPNQLELRIVPPPDKKNRKAKYPFEMVKEARKMRRFQFTYVEIAEALNDHFKTDVKWITVRDWLVNAYRFSK